ncbi:MAG: ExbD/TolR family protein [Kiritimatiellia bacterium]|jgi:biopolymer transport protein ExbD
MKALVDDDGFAGVRIAPLLDVVFLLLIFFLVATTFYEIEKDMSIRLAEATAGEGRSTLPRQIIVNISEAGILVVNQRMVSLGELETMLREGKEDDPRLSVVIRCDRQARHADFVKVLDCCGRIRISQVSIATLHVDE